MPDINFSPSWKQHLAWQALEDGTTEEVVYGGAAGGGKSFLGAAWKIYRRLRYPGSRGITGRTVMKDIKESTLVTFFKVLGLWGLKSGVDYTYNAQDFYLKFANGSREVFRDLGYSPSDHDYQRLGSSEYTDAWIEEAGDGVPEKAADILKSRIRWMLPEFGLVPKLLITCNPGYHWVRGKYFFDGDDRPVVLQPHQVVIEAKVTDNPDREFVRIYKKSLEGLSSDYDRQRLLDGDWNAVERTGGEFYPSFETQRHTGDYAGAYDPLLPLHLTFDFNTAPYVTGLAHQVRGKQVTQVGEVTLPSPNNNTLACARGLVARYPAHAAEVFVYGDPAGQSADTRSEKGQNDYTILIDVFVKAGWKVSKRVAASAPSVSMRGLWIDKVLSEHAGGIELRVDKSCRNTIQDYQKVKKAADGTKSKKRISDPKTGVSYEQYGHCTDANDYFLCRCFSEEYAAFQRPNAGPVPTLITRRPRLNSY